MTQRRFFLSILVSLVALGACGSRPAVEPAELVLRGGSVTTMDAVRSRAEAVAVAGGNIVFVGSTEGAEAYIGPETRVVDLEGESVLPGFHDSHVHPVSGGVELAQCDLNGLATRDALLEKISSCADTAGGGEWIVGGGWELTLFPAANPSAAALDAIVSDHPVYLSSADGHSAWVNGEALKRAGIDASTPDPVNGRIERHPATRRPSGTLRESAATLVSRHLPKLTLEDRVDGLKRALAMANRFGITSLVEASAGAETLAAYESLARSGGLTARVRVSLHVDESRDETQVADLVALRDGVSAPRLSVASAKMFADGVIEAHTAALLAPYVGLDTAGELNFEPERMNRIVAALDAAGFQIHIHAIGDRAIRASLDAIEHARSENGPRDARPQLAHIELFDPEDIPRFAALGVVADFQPLWAYADSYITDLTEPVLGPERSRWLYPIKSVVDSGAMVAAGSDWSVSSMNPLDAMQVAVTRRGLDDAEGEPWIPEERVDLETILAAYTLGGAWVQFQEDRTGSIEVGKAADLVVLDRNLFEVPDSEIHRVEVLLTLLEGEEVYRSERFTK